jgi:hypothetical protein
VTFSNISLAGTLYPTDTYTSPALTSTSNVNPESAIAYAGVSGTSNLFPEGTSFTNLLVTGPLPVPEPCTYEFLAAGALALGATRFRRRQNA